MDSHKVNGPANEFINTEKILPIQSQNVSITNTESNEATTVPDFDPRMFGGFDGFKDVLSEDWAPIPGAATMNCRKAHPLRLKRKPKMRIPFYLPNLPEEDEFDVEPFMLEDFPEEIDWSRQYYQPAKELSHIRPDIISWDYVPPYDPKLAKEFDERAEHITPENLDAQRVSLNKLSANRFPKFYREQQGKTLEESKTFEEEKERSKKFFDWMVATQGIRGVEQAPFDGDWQKEQHEGWEVENRFGQDGWKMEEVVDDEKALDPEKAEGEAALELEGEGSGQRDGGGWSRGGWNRGMSRGGRGRGFMGRGGGFGRGEDRGRGFRGGFSRGYSGGSGWGGGGDLSRGFSRGFSRGRGRGRGWEERDDDVDLNADTKFHKTLLGI